MKRTFVLDFDGTVTSEDVCSVMASVFCRPGYMELEEKWARGEITTTECARGIINLMDVTEDELLKFIYDIEIDLAFGLFVDYCRQEGDMIWIVSDGYDFYIDPILNRYGWGDIPYISNKMYFKNKKICVEFPNLNIDCGQCGTCKRAFIEGLKRRGQKVIFIGDGPSDFCAAERAELVFAKKALLGYCRENNLRYIEYTNFKDIVKFLESDR